MSRHQGKSDFSCHDPLKTFSTLGLHLSWWKYEDFWPGPRDGGGPLKFICYILLTGHSERGSPIKCMLLSSFAWLNFMFSDTQDISGIWSELLKWSLFSVLTHYSLVCLPRWTSQYREMVTDHNLGRRGQKVGHLNVSAAVHSETLILSSSLWDEWNRCRHTLYPHCTLGSKRWI